MPSKKSQRRDRATPEVTVGDLEALDVFSDSFSDSFSDATKEMIESLARMGSTFGAVGKAGIPTPESPAHATLYKVDGVTGDLTATVSGNITPEQALEVILMDINAEALKGEDAVAQKASYWLTRITNEITAITRHNDEE